MPSSYSRLLPFLSWWHKVNRASLRLDLVAGLTGALIVLPQGIAYAAIAGMPPAYGLYASVGPAIIGALFGSSWHLVSGPTAPISIVVLSALAPLAEPGSPHFVELAITLGFLVGIIQLALGLFRLGRLTDYISHGVVVGFTSGSALLIAASQIRQFFGLKMPASAMFFVTLRDAVERAPSWTPAIACTGAVTMLAALAARRFVPKIPYLVVGMVAGGIAAAFFNAELGANAVPTVGALPGAVPPLSHPLFDPAVWGQLAQAAASITLLALTQAIASARAVALRSGQDLDGNQEFIGQGLANLVGSFFSGYPTSGSFTRTGANFDAGAQTPLAAVFAGLLLMALLFLVAPLLTHLPVAAMAGVLFIIAWGLADARAIKELWRDGGLERAVFAVTFMATLVLRLEYAVMVGIGLSLAGRFLLRRRDAAGGKSE
ncbi:MAG: sulfate transporter [Betaproteobacteria bacterium]|nr:sulfate transporter [Betaproteobacteria bacterium]